MKTFRTFVDEASYEGNMGAVEVMKFYQSATDSQIDKLERFIARQDWSKAWQLVQKVTGVKLMGKAFEFTLLNEIGDASARPYKLKYKIKHEFQQSATFIVPNEDYDPNDPKKDWDDIEMTVNTHIMYEGSDLDQAYFNVTFRTNEYKRRFDTLDIGLKYLFRIMATVVNHVKNHIEYYEDEIERFPGMAPLLGLAFDSSDRKRGRRTSRGKTQRNKLYKAYIQKSLKKMYPRATVEEKYGGEIFVHFNKDES